MAQNKYAGTQTEKNLQEAFAGESQARNKYTYFASVAKKEGYEQMAAIFLKTADILQWEQKLRKYVRYAIIRRVILKYVQRIIKGEYIEWITLNTNQGVYRKQLNP